MGLTLTTHVTTFLTEHLAKTAKPLPAMPYANSLSAVIGSSQWRHNGVTYAKRLLREPPLKS